MRHIRLGIICSLALLLLSFAPQGAFAHGEAADEPFLKDLTTAFYDVHISPTNIKVGEPVTITGRVTILDTWPYTLDPPQTAYITPVVPGPVFALTDRIVNGDPTFGSILVDKGRTYEFKMTMLGRTPGHWHVHPGIGIQGTGTLLGPGEWVTVEPSDKPFVLPVTLQTGETVDLEQLGGSFVWWWSLFGFLIGLVWMIYWTVPKRTVTRLAVTAQLPVNDDAPDIGLITPRDHFWMDILAGLTIVTLVVGWVYMAGKYPVRLPQQTDRWAPVSLTPTDHLAEVHPLGAVFDDKTDTLTINAEVKNLGTNPLNLNSYVMGMASFVNGTKDDMAKAGPADFVNELKVSPDGPIAPGETRKVTLTMTSEIFDQERLVPLHDPQQLIAGVFRFSDSQGRQDIVTVKSTLVPTEFRAQYLP